MSRTGEEEEEDERFYESLDRLLSSASSCTCSSSSGEEEDEDDDEERDPNSVSLNYAPDLLATVPRFPMGLYNNYDVWISEPSSIEERRMRLFTQMGLIRDPALSPRKTTLSSTAQEEGGSVCRGDFSRSASYDQSSCSQQCVEASSSSSTRVIVRSKSDGSTDHRRGSSSHGFHSPEILSINSVLLSSTNATGTPVNNHIGNGNESTITSAASPNKPPSGKNSRKMEDIRNGSNSPEISCNGEMDNDDSGGTVCTIKDLDNGKQFVVNEIREDGMWNKLKEVGTGRQLTMEEFEMCVGHSPIVQELMRREIVEDGNTDLVNHIMNGSLASGSKLKKKGSWLKSIRQVASTMTGYKERRSSDEKDTSSEKGGRRSSSATDDSQDVLFRGPERVRVRQYGKTYKELSSLYKSQEIQAHNGSIWTIKFSLDGKYLASAGEDCVIHIWQVVQSERKRHMFMERHEDGGLNISVGSPEPGLLLSPKLDGSAEKKRKGRSSFSRKSVNFEPVMIPEAIFALSEKPFCSLQGHLDDVLDLSWSKSQHLLSSSMDKTVRLWDMSSKSCLKIFEHNDFVTCIQFNPMDDRFFISGSLDAKVRIWSVPDHQVVDWSDLHEMVTAACYAPDGQVALVGSHKGSCHLYDTSENKLQEKGHVNLQNRKKKSHCKKITGFQFAPGSSSQVLVTSADSRIRVIEGADLVHKFKGFRNTNSQILACFSANGKHVVCASEDSHVYIWKHEDDTRPTTRSKGVTRTQSYEHFHCQDVTVAIPWPEISISSSNSPSPSGDYENFTDSFDDVSTANHPPTPVEEELMGGGGGKECSSLNGIISSASSSYFLDRMSATWPEEKLLSVAKKNNNSPRVSVDCCDALSAGRSSAWGMVIVTAGLNGEIRAYQNFGLPVRL